MNADRKTYTRKNQEENYYQSTTSYFANNNNTEIDIYIETERGTQTDRYIVR